jgi:hypothetical protein
MKQLLFDFARPVKWEETSQYFCACGASTTTKRLRVSRKLKTPPTETHFLYPHVCVTCRRAHWGLEPHVKNHA